MDETLTTLTTPGGYLVEFQPFLTTGGRRAVQRELSKYMPDVSPGFDLDDLTVSMEGTMAAEETALRHLVAKVVTPEGHTASDPVDAVAAMPEQDGNAVYARVNEITNANQVSGDESKNVSAASAPSSAE